MFKTSIKLAALLGLIVLPATAAEKKNVLFIVVDDLKPTLGCYGDNYVKSPNIDKLAASGTLFTSAYTNQAVCAASRCSFFSGLRPDRTKVHDLKTDFLEVTPWVVTLPEYLIKNGYTTAGCGKLFHGGKSDAKMEKRAWQTMTSAENLPYAKGFNPPALHYQSKQAQGIVDELRKKNQDRYGKMVQALKDAKANPATENLDIPDDAYDDGAIAKEALNYIDQLSKGDKPFFVAAGFKKPHLPFVAPKKYWDMYQREEVPIAKYQQPAKDAPAYALHSWGELKNYSDISQDGPVPMDKQRELIHGYYACTSYVDAQIGVLLDGLKERGLDKNTIVVLLSDHGWHLGDHGVWCKHTNYEQATRSCLMFSGPDISAGKKTDSPTELVDVFSTICEMVSVPVPKNLDGISLKPLLEDSEKHLREVAVSSYPRYNGRMGYTMRDKRYRYVAWVKNDNLMKPLESLGVTLDEELYDYQKDALETTNMAKDVEMAAVIKTFRARLDKHLKDQAQRIKENNNPS
ncbi:iduronate-2-sulfatase [Oceaniferula spumae]|uniref:Iduronate-2-sulfatase n=1 Tax=Oceaniferula spumae TaxID=2979115 RepID=A0AAT9FGH4_9BACT